jgi:hypothetical protein
LRLHKELPQRARCIGRVINCCTAAICLATLPVAGVVCLCKEGEKPQAIVSTPTHRRTPSTSSRARQRLATGQLTPPARQTMHVGDLPTLSLPGVMPDAESVSEG